MRCFLVTGPIGSGKSEACRYLASLSYPVYDCDSRTKLLYEKVPGLKSRIEEELDINWSEISIVFSDPCRLRKLESIVYPLVVDDIKAWKASLGDCGLCFIESAIAMDKREFDLLYDGVLLVQAPYDIRLGRNKAVSVRDALQKFDLEKVDYIIQNDSSVEELHEKIDKLICRLI